MSRDIVRTDRAPIMPFHSQAVRAAGLVFVSAQAPIDPETGEISGTSVQEQTRQSLANLAAVLEAAGTSMDRLVSCTYLLAEESDFPGMNDEWLRWFPVDGPARQGGKLPARPRQIRVSISAIAQMP